LFISAQCKVWRIKTDVVELVQTLALTGAATAIDARDYRSKCVPSGEVLPDPQSSNRTYAALGTEQGAIGVYVLQDGQLQLCGELTAQ
jgi:hypothetical protein